MLRLRIRARDTLIQDNTCPLRSRGRKAIGSKLDMVAQGKTKCMSDETISSLLALVDSISSELLPSHRS